MEAYIRRAVALAFKEICFLDHLIFGKNGKHNSMVPEEVGLYFQAVQHFKHKYKDRIKIKAGLEIDYDPDFLDRIYDIVNRFAFDVIGSSVHFVENRNIVSGRAMRNQPTMDIHYFLNAYIEQLDKMLDENYFDIICHIDAIKKFNPDMPEELNKKYDEILSKIRYKNLTVEVNTSGYLHPVKTIYPDVSLLQTCYEKNVHITIGSDAHHPDNVGQYFNQVLPILRSAGYTELSGFSKRKRHAVSIKA